MQICNATRKDGEQCETNALVNDDKCYFHSENAEIIEKRKKGSALGGSNSKIIIEEPIRQRVPVNKLEDIVDLLEDVINDIRMNKITSTKANCIGYLAGTLAKVLESRDIERRVLIIEQIISKRGKKDG